MVLCLFELRFHSRLLGNFAKHQRAFSKLVIHLIAVYCHALQNGALYPEAKVREPFLDKNETLKNFDWINQIYLFIYFK